MTTPTFDPNIPQFLNDSFATTQPQFLRNFETLFTAFARNHVALDSATNIGNHTFVNLLQQLSSIETDVSEISIYTKDVEDQTAQVFFRYQGNGQEFQFTNYQLYNLLQTTDRTQYFTVLPGKVMIYFGTFKNLKTKTLELLPAIAKNIITISFCPIGTAAPKTQQYKPNVTLEPKNEKGFYDAIKVYSQALGVPPDCFYFIMVNI